jgi:hypothetical protein
MAKSETFTSFDPADYLNESQWQGSSPSGTC